MAGHKKGTVKYNIQLHPRVIAALSECAALTGHPTGNVLATELIQIGLDYLNGASASVPPALAALRASLTGPAPKGRTAAPRPTAGSIADTVAENSRQIAELTKLVHQALGTARRGGNRGKA